MVIFHFLFCCRPIVSTISSYCTSFFCVGIFVFFTSATPAIASDTTCSDFVSVDLVDPEVRNVTLLVHGLNNSQKAFTPLRSVLEGAVERVISTTLSGHEWDWDELTTPTSKSWVNDVRRAYCELRLKYPNSTITTVGFSLGALSVARFIQEYPDARIAKNVYISPAFFVKPRLSVMAAPFLWLRHLRVWLPSFTPSDYRLRAFTSVQSYYATFRSIEDFQESWNPDGKLARIPSLVFIRKGDELVDVDEIIGLASKNEQGSWKLVVFPEIDKSGVHQHLIIDEYSMGQAAWNSMKTELVEFLKADEIVR